MQDDIRSLKWFCKVVAQGRVGTIMNLLGESSSLNPIFNIVLWKSWRLTWQGKIWVLDQEGRINPEINKYWKHPKYSYLKQLWRWRVLTWLCRLYQTPIRIPQLYGSGCQVAHGSIFIYIICAVCSPHHCSGGVTWTSWKNAHSVNTQNLDLNKFFFS